MPVLCSRFAGWLQRGQNWDTRAGRSRSVDLGSTAADYLGLMMSKQESSRVRGRGRESIGYLQALRRKPESTRQSKRKSNLACLFAPHLPGEIFPRIPSNDSSSDLARLTLMGISQPTLAQQRTGKRIFVSCCHIIPLPYAMVCILFVPIRRIRFVCCIALSSQLKVLTTCEKTERNTRAQTSSALARGIPS